MLTDWKFSKVEGEWGAQISGTAQEIKDVADSILGEKITVYRRDGKFSTFQVGQIVNTIRGYADGKTLLVRFGKPVDFPPKVLDTEVIDPFEAAKNGKEAFQRFEKIYLLARRESVSSSKQIKEVVDDLTVELKIVQRMMRKLPAGDSPGSYGRIVSMSYTISDMKKDIKEYTEWANAKLEEVSTSNAFDDYTFERPYLPKRPVVHENYPYNKRNGVVVFEKRSAKLETLVRLLKPGDIIPVHTKASSWDSTTPFVVVEIGMKFRSSKSFKYYDRLPEDEHWSAHIAIKVKPIRTKV